MNFKENLGVDPVTLSKGYTKLDGQVPNSGENILHPEHLQDGYGIGTPHEDGIGGFLAREKPAPFERPLRTEDEDRG